jgi:hypothetical protein
MLGRLRSGLLLLGVFMMYHTQASRSHKISSRHELTSQRSNVPRSGKLYEFPNGFATTFHTERFLPGECFFSQQAFGVDDMIYYVLDQWLTVKLELTKPTAHPAGAIAQFHSFVRT